MDNATQTKDKTMTNQAETIDNILAKIAREVRTERAAKAEHAAQRDAQRDARRVEIAEYKRRGGVLGGVGGGIA